jgi:radical SAM protein with 4Fe4S-binding SPASM domain
MTRPRGEMSDELFHKIVKEGKEMSDPFFVPFLNGEPFVFPKIWEWLDYLEREKCRVHIYTNAEFLDVDRLIKYKNIALICCSINAATEETYDKIMRGPDFEKVVKNVEELFEKSKLKQLFASMVIVDANKHETEMFREKWGKHTIFGEFKNWGGLKHDRLERHGKRNPCWGVFNTINILWDGRVVPCCMDYDGRLILGDVNENTLTEIFHKAKWLRDKHRALKFNYIPCEECNQNIL